jgi:lysozyme family protein
MASSSKKKTTFAKMTRENTVREKRLRKAAKKEARKHAPLDQQSEPSDEPAVDDSDDATVASALESEPSR